LGETTSHHLAGGADLLAQQLEPALRFEEIPAQGLERHLDPELEVEGMPHLTHTTATEHLEDLVALAEDLAGGEGLETLRHVEGLALTLGAGSRQEFTVGVGRGRWGPRPVVRRPAARAHAIVCSVAVGSPSATKRKRATLRPIQISSPSVRTDGCRSR
jgi:hypothetical protein